jgi:hypothetical protein
MEKTLMGTVGTVIITWVGILTGTKVDKTACVATHKGVCEKLDLLLKNQDVYGQRVEYIIARLDRHIDGNGNGKVGTP